LFVSIIFSIGNSGYYTLDTFEWDKIGKGGYYSGTLKLVYDWRHPAFETTDPDWKPTSQSEYTLGAEKMLMENLSATVRFVRKHLRYIMEDVGVITTKGEVYFETNPGYGYSQTGTAEYPIDPRFWKCPKAKREYYALNFSLDKRLANNWLAGLSYTWSRLVGNTAGLASSDEYGRVSPYVERTFDVWHMAYTKDGKLLDGPLPTDRTHFLKLYGAYTFPFRLTVGTVINAYSGTPFTERWNVIVDTWFPFNRGYYRDDNGNLVNMRTPFVWFANAYAEYNLKLGKYMLNFNVNVDNAFNTDVARRLYESRTRYALKAATGFPNLQEMVLSKNWDLTSPGVGYTADARFLQEMEFFPPISIRFGIKFIF
ncbi:MAG: hypothetical protein QHH14_13290, partial [Clostridiales bacterium]|nr:hypothetical protein [Clostridiales bacterium]